MTTKEILLAGRQIWGDDKQSVEHILACLAKTQGDIAREVRSKFETGTIDAVELKKEFGNLLVSTTRWIDDLGFDSKECIKLALASQAAYKRKQK